VDTIKFLGTLEFKKEYDVFRYQLSRSATSMGANYEEAQGAFSKKKFASKVGICLKEAKESNYFYRVIQALKMGNQDEGVRLIQESDELQKIFGSILIKVKGDI
jgi:four helix bundle protein